MDICSYLPGKNNILIYPFREDDNQNQNSTEHYCLLPVIHLNRALSETVLCKLYSTESTDMRTLCQKCKPFCVVLQGQNSLNNNKSTRCGCFISSYLPSTPAFLDGCPKTHQCKHGFFHYNLSYHRNSRITCHIVNTSMYVYIVGH